MSQATTYGYGTYVAADAPKSPEQVAARIKDTFDAIASQHAGSSRPSYAVAGMIWHDEDTGVWKMWDGASDTPIPRQVSVPSFPADIGQPGDWAADSAYLYIYVGTGLSGGHVWLRIAGASSW